MSMTVSLRPKATIPVLVTLADGSAAMLRPMEADDVGALLAFHRGLSDRSRYLRYFYPHATLRADEVAHLTQVDGVARVALVLEQRGVLLAVGRYDRLHDPRHAEVAFVVADKFQHGGIATLLLDQLVRSARASGITHLEAEVLADNTAMLSVFRATRFPTHRENEWGTVHLTMAIGPTAALALDHAGTRQSSRVPPPSTG
jgi:RimJ/RimL family protein N-acetyltransferase